LAICDYFKWSLKDVHDLLVSEYRAVVKYLKKVNRENEKALRKAKRKRK